MTTGPKQENRGGARPNSGPKPRTLSANQVAKMLRKARRRAKSTGKDVDDILLDFIYADEVRIADRVACIKLWKEFTMAKLAEGGDEMAFEEQFDFQLISAGQDRFGQV